MTDALAALGWNDRWLALYTSAVEGRAAAHPSRPGRVVRHDGVAVLVAGDEGTESLPVLASVEPAPVVGDWVVVDDDTDAVVEVLDRASLLRRQDPDGATMQALVANLDVLLIVCGLDRPVKPGRIQRSAALAWDAGATPVVVLTKADLADDVEVDAVAEGVRAGEPRPRRARHVRRPASRASTRSGPSPTGRTIVLLGESGAGKSTLTNALVGDDVVRHRRGAGGRLEGSPHHDPPGAARAAHRRRADRHARASARSGCGSTPTPSPPPSTTSRSSAEGCRFRDCAHAGEPGCAVAAAVEAGELRRGAVGGVARRCARRPSPPPCGPTRTPSTRPTRRFGKIAREAQRRSAPERGARSAYGQG